MALNWNIEVIVDFIISLVILINMIVTHFTSKSQKITSLLYIRLSIFGMCIFMVMDGLSFLFVSEMFARITGIILFPTTIFLIIGINYTIKETFYSKGLVMSFGLGILFFYLTFHPRVAESGLEAGYLRMNWTGAFNILAIMFTTIIALYLFYWGLKTWINAPVLIKKEASIFFLGIIITSPVGMVFYLLYLIEPVFILASDFAIIIGILIFLIAILREPKLLYILPFTVYRISVKDREGFPLFDHDWSKSNISDTIFTGFLNAVQLMSEEVMNIGGLLDINLEEGILILRESKLITVGLVASKSSKLLSESVVKFTYDFEMKFEKELKKSVKDISQYEDGFELIEKYFSNFPYKILKSKKQPLLLAGKYARIPLEIENKLKSIFTDEKEYEFIKTELQRSPFYFTKEFLSLYDEMKKEQRVSGEDPKYLDTELSENE